MTDLGYQTRAVSDCVVPTTRPTTAAKFATYQKLILVTAQDARVATHRWHAAYDWNCSHLVFAVGDKVLRNTENLELTHLASVSSIQGSLVPT